MHKRMGVLTCLWWHVCGAAVNMCQKARAGCLEAGLGVLKGACIGCAGGAELAEGVQAS